MCMMGEGSIHMPWGTSGSQRAILGVGFSLPPYFETGSPIVHSHISQLWCELQKILFSASHHQKLTEITDMRQST